MADPQPTTEELRERKGALLNLFERLLPVVDGIADSFRFATLLGLVLLVWVVIWMFHFGGFEVGTVLIAGAVMVLPVLVLSYFWWGLEGLKKLPETVAELVSDTRDEVREQVLSIRSAEKKVGLLGSAGRLWELRSIAGEARELLGSYVQISTLVNPVSLILGFLSLMFIGVLALTGVALAIAALI
jgi:hypothetical protein